MAGGHGPKRSALQDAEGYGGQMVDTTEDPIAEIQRRSDELDRILDAYSRLKQD